jgi:hypothetical protein
MEHQTLCLADLPSDVRSVSEKSSLTEATIFIGFINIFIPIFHL